MASSVKDLSARFAAKKKGARREYSAIEECMDDLAAALAKKDSAGAAKAFKEASALCSDDEE